MRVSSRDHLDRRCAELWDRCDARELHGLLVTHLPNVYYLTGLRATAAAVIVEPERVTLITDARYLTAAQTLVDRGQAPSRLSVVRVDGSYDETILDRLKASGATRIGIESDAMTVQRWTWLRESLGQAVTLVPTGDLVEAGRVIKDQGEQRRLRAAGQMLADLVSVAVGCVRAGRTERAIAADIEHAMATTGFEDRAFPTIVAAGERSALPHARPSERILADGDLVVLDFGGVYDGYCVDLTRTVCVRRADPEATRLHGAVLAAQTAAIAALRPGVLASRVDAAARQVLAEHGLAEAFGHGTGHGLGVEVHEAPRLAPADQLRRSGSDVVLRAGMACTIEPGVYLPGVGGVRIEDDILLTDDGCEVLTEAPRGLTVCGIDNS